MGKRAPNTYPAAEVSVSTKRDVLTEREKQSAVKMLGQQILSDRGKNTLSLSDTRSLGAGDSAHGVFFARAENGHESDIPNGVAIKRFRREESALQELDNIRTAAKLGFRTVEPVGNGVIDIGEMGTALVTSVIPRFTTMNQVGWQDYIVGQPGYERLTEVLSAVGGFAGSIHEKGMVHNDLQIKNVGQVPTGEFIVFDVEGSRFHAPQHDDSSEGLVFAEGCYSDMSKLVSSLIERRYLASATDATFEKEIADVLLTPYLENGGNPYVLDNYDRLMGDALEFRAAAPGLSHSEIGRLALV